MIEYGRSFMVAIEDGKVEELSKTAFRIVEGNYNSTVLLKPEYQLGPMKFIAGPVYNVYDEYDDEGRGVGDPKPGVKNYTFGWVAEGVEVEDVRS